MGGLDKIQAKLDDSVAAREEVEAQNVALGQNKAALNAQVEAMSDFLSPYASFWNSFGPPCNRLLNLARKFYCLLIYLVRHYVLPIYLIEWPDLYILFYYLCAICGRYDWFSFLNFRFFSRLSCFLSLIPHLSLIMPSLFFGGSQLIIIKTNAI